MKKTKVVGKNGWRHRPMMTCGHAANATCTSMGGVRYDPPIWSCVICDCVEVADKQPDPAGRKARCAYYGKPTRRNECNKCDSVCQCERDSTDWQILAFFEHKPDQEFDRFYCGCHSWE